MHRLSGADDGFLFIESPTQVSTCVTVAELAAAVPGGPGPVTFDDLRRHVLSRLDVLPSFRWRLRRVPFGLNHPVMVEEPRLDLAYHFRHVSLPGPGTVEQLDRYVASVSRTRLDRRHPLWQIILVDGLAGDRQVVIFLIHHTIADGVAWTTSLDRLLGDGPVPATDHGATDGDTGGATDGATDGVDGDVDNRDPGWLPVLLAALVDQLRALARLPRLVLQTRAHGRAVRERRRTNAVPVPKSMVDTPPTSLNDCVTLDRVTARTTVSLADLRRVRQASGVTINDVALAMVAGALRRHLEEIGETPGGALTVNVPVSGEPDGAPPRQFGNGFNNILSTLATDIDDPWERLLTISVVTAEARHRLELAGREIVRQWLDYAAPFFAEPVVRAWASMRRRHPEKAEFSVLVSNVRSAPNPWSLSGLPVEHLWISGPTFDGGGVNVTLVSRGGDIDLAVMANPSALPDPAALIAGLHRALDELLAVVDEGTVSEDAGTEAAAAR